MAPTEFSASIDGMARRLRIQYPDARYHVINRGNLSHAAFIATTRCGWADATFFVSPGSDARL